MDEATDPSENKISGESQNLDDIDGDTASDVEDPEAEELHAPRTVASDDLDSEEDEEADEEPVDAEDVLEELTFYAQKKLTDVAK